jgi:hypothetical protein
MGTIEMVYRGTLFHRRQRGIPMHSYENRSQIRALPARLRGPCSRPCQCLLLLDAPQQLALMRTFAHAVTDTTPHKLPATAGGGRHARPRVGFVSSDLGNHPLGHDFSHCPGRPGRALSALSVFLCKSVFYGAFVWARRALNSEKRRFPARAVFGLLDRAKFEVFAFNLRAEPGLLVVPPGDHTKLIRTAALWVNPLATPRVEQPVFCGRTVFVCARKLARKYTSLPSGPSQTRAPGAGHFV